jgi:hypothetical protein
MRAIRSVTDVNRNVQEDSNIFLVDATGWVSYEDVFPDSFILWWKDKSKSRTNSLLGWKIGAFTEVAPQCERAISCHR